MGHRLANHGGKCRFLHGHNYVVDVRLHGDVNKVTGMVIDFHDLKDVVRTVLDPYDHSFILEEGDNILREVPQERIIYMTGPPTAENLAKLWRESIEALLYTRGLPFRAASVSVQETEQCRVVAP